MTESPSEKSPHTERLFDETMSRMTDVITFRAPTGEAKATLEEYAKTQGESLSDFVRTAIAQRVQRIDAAWVPTGDPAVDRRRMQ